MPLSSVWGMKIHLYLLCLEGPGSWPAILAISTNSNTSLSLIVSWEELELVTLQTKKITFPGLEKRWEGKEVFSYPKFSENWCSLIWGQN